MIVNELVTKFSFNVGSSFKKLDRNLGQTVKNTNTATTKMGGAFKRMGDSVKSALKFKINVLGSAQAKAIIGNLHNQIKNMKRSASSPLGGMLGGAIGIGAATGAAMSVLETAKSYESLRASLVSAMGGAEGANRQFKQLQDFAKTTPYSLEESVKGFVRLKNLGLDTSERSMRSFGNTAGAMSKSMMDMIEAVADASTGEFERLKEFGIKAKSEGDKVTFTFQGMKTTVKNDAASIQKYLVDLGETKFGGGMALQSKTIGGAMSNLQDSLDQAKFAMWQSGMGQAVTELVKGFTKIIENSKPLMIQFGLLAKNNLPWMFKAIGDALPIVSFGLSVMAIRFGALKSMQLAAWAVTLATEIKAVGVAAWFTNTAIGFIPGLIIGAIAAIALFAADTISYMHTGKSALLDFTAKWPWLHKAIKWVMDFSITFFTALGMGLQKLAEFWVPKLVSAFNFFKDTWVGIFNLVKPQFDTLLNIIKSIGDTAKTAFNAVSGLFNQGGTSTPNVGSEEGYGSGGGSSNQRVLGAAMRFSAGAPGQSDADKWAKNPNNRVKGGGNYWHNVRQLYIKGVACDITTEKVLELAGADQAVQNAMVGQVDATLKNLLRQGLAEVVPRSQLKGGELFYAWSDKYNTWGHTGIVGQGGKSLIHASNNSGGQIGMGQRFTETSNYLSDRAMFIRIKDEHMKNKPMQISMTFNGNMDSRQVRQSAQDGLLDALNRNQPRRVPAGGDALT